MRAKHIFYTRFQKILCVFFQIFRFLVKLKLNEKEIQKIIYIDCDHVISKCTSIIELSPPDNRPRDDSWPVQYTNTLCQLPRITLYYKYCKILYLNDRHLLEFLSLSLSSRGYILACKIAKPLNKILCKQRYIY